VSLYIYIYSIYTVCVCVCQRRRCLLSEMRPSLHTYKIICIYKIYVFTYLHRGWRHLLREAKNGEKKTAKTKRRKKWCCLDWGEALLMHIQYNIYNMAYISTTYTYTHIICIYNILQKYQWCRCLWQSSSPPLPCLWGLGSQCPCIFTIKSFP
jgi:hypothetical protein